MKKEYIRPEAEKINFQAEEVMTTGIDGSFFRNGGSVGLDPEDWLLNP